jgi:hypothetical protein
MPVGFKMERPALRQSLESVSLYIPGTGKHAPNMYQVQGERLVGQGGATEQRYNSEYGWICENQALKVSHCFMTNKMVNTAMSAQFGVSTVTL